MRTDDVVGDVTLPDDIGMAIPGDTVDLTVRLGHPVPLEPGLGFVIRVGGRTVGAGTVLSTD